MIMRTRSMTLTAAAIASLLASAPLATTAGAQQRGAGRGMTREQPVTPSDMGLHGYSVVLVIGDMQAPGSGDTVPSAARKALTDMQAFLPYKRYQLLDAAWMICCGAFRSPLSGRVRGPENGEYQYTIETMNPAEGDAVTVRFSMRDMGSTANAYQAIRPQGAAAGGVGRGGSSSAGRGTARGSSTTGLSEGERVEHARQLYDAVRERDAAELTLRTTKASYTDSHPQVVAATARYSLAQRRVEDLQHMAQGGGVSGGGGGRGSAGRTIMDSTFSIALGETVVIGTSRLKGDQALIALLTAAKRPGASR
jgi:hypothetical protein